MARNGRRAVFAALLASFLLLVGISSVAAQSGPEPTFLVRGIDGTSQKAVAMTVLWTGDTKALQELTIRENGAAVKVDDLVDLRKTGRRLGTVAVVDLSGSMADDGALLG